MVRRACAADHQSTTNARKILATTASFPFHCAHLRFICAHWQPARYACGGDCALGPRAPHCSRAGKTCQIRRKRRKQANSDQIQRVPQHMQAMESAAGQVLLAQLLWTQRKSAFDSELRNRHFYDAQNSRKSKSCCKTFLHRFFAVRYTCRLLWNRVKTQVNPVILQTPQLYVLSALGA